MISSEFNYHSIQEVENDIYDKTGLRISIIRSNSTLLNPINIGKYVVKNRILAQPIEGCDALDDGSPSERTVERYVDLARNDYGIIWIESTSVSEKGRTNPKQLRISKDNVEVYKEMVRKIKASCFNPPLLILQLTHSGRNSRPISYCAFENPYIPVQVQEIVTDDDIRIIEDEYVNAAQLAAEAGFDAVDIRTCHGYLINELLAAYQRPGVYGGSFDNRTRMLRNIVEKIKKTSPIMVAVRLNVFDGIPYPYGWGCKKESPLLPDLEEPLRLISILKEYGVSLINITAGVGAVCPHIIRPYDSRADNLPEYPIEGVIRMLSFAKKVKDQHEDMVVVGSALSWLRDYAPYLAATLIENKWFDIAGFGRMTIAYPEFPKELLKGNKLSSNKCCKTCGACTTMAKKGNPTKCVWKKDA